VPGIVELLRVVRRLARIITLAELRAHAATRLEGMQLLPRAKRLAVLPIRDARWRFMLSLE